jgi:hypothetical protein
MGCEVNCHVSLDVVLFVTGMDDANTATDGSFSCYDFYLGGW